MDGLGGARGRKDSSKTDKDASGPWEGREPAPGRARPEGTSYRVTPGRFTLGNGSSSPGPVPSAKPERDETTCLQGGHGLGERDLK